MYKEIATVWSHECLAKDVLVMEIAAENIARDAKPGQFVHVRPVGASLDPLLRRPISIHKVDPQKGRVWLLYQVRGKGTEIFSRLREGDAVDVMGPIGNGFDIDAGKAPFLLIGGGMGVAPILFTAQRLEANNIPCKVLLAARTAGDLYSKEDYTFLEHQLIVATDDGSLGFHGNAVQAAAKLLKNGDIKTILACGPDKMLAGLGKLAEESNVEVQISLEARMACGVGACLGCTVKKASTNGYFKVCKDGPVFTSQEVDLNA